jgi:hypothetical protein
MAKRKSTNNDLQIIHMCGLIFSFLCGILSVFWDQYNVRPSSIYGFCVINPVWYFQTSSFQKYHVVSYETLLHLKDVLNL